MIEDTLSVEKVISLTTGVRFKEIIEDARILHILS